MNKLVKRIISIVCVISMLMGTGAVPVLAEEVGQAESVINDNTTTGEGLPERHIPVEEEGEDKYDDFVNADESVAEIEETGEEIEVPFSVPITESIEEGDESAETMALNESDESSVQEEVVEEIISIEDASSVGAYEEPDYNSCVSSYSELVSRLDYLKSKYVGTYWTTDGQPSNSEGDTSLSYYGIQCNGFAKLIFTDLFNTGSIGKYDSNKYYFPEPNGAYLIGKNASVGSGDANAVKEILQNGEIGDFIQVHRRGKTYGHSMILTGKDDGGIWILDCNSDGHCKVQHYYQSYSTFASKNDKMSLYRSVNYPSNPVDPNAPVSGWINVAAGTNYTPTSIWWDSGSNVKYYDVKLWRGSLWEGDAYTILWSLTDTSCSVNLPSGYYEGYVDYRNSDSLSMSRNTISFTVGEGQPVDLGDGFYAVILVNDTWKPLTVSGSNVQLGDSEGKETYWKFERQSDGSYVIRNAANDYVLETEGIKDENQTNVEVYPFNGGDNQKWYIYGRWSGEYYFRPKSATRVLDVYGGKNVVGDNLNLWDLNYSPAQKFAIYKHDVPGAAKLTCTPGTSAAPTEFRWSETTETKTYTLRIYKGEHWVGENIKNVWDLTTTSCSVQLPAGDYEAYVDSANVFAYTMSNVVKISVGKASLSGAAVTGITNRTYNGSAQTQNPTVKINNKTLTNGTDYTLSYANNVNAGKATVTITGKGDFTGTISKDFTINAASISGATDKGIVNKTYNGSAQTQNPTVKLGERTLTNGTDYTLSYVNNTNAGTATVTITGKGNYNGTVSKNFAISQAAPKLSFASAKVEKTTLSAPFTNTLTKTTDGTVSFTSGNTNVAVVDNSGKVTIKGTGTTTITATATAGKNYKAGSASYTLTVVDGRTDISACKITLSPTSYTYDGTVKTPAVTIKNGTATLTNGTDYTVSYTNNTNAGTATVTVTGKGNYAGTITATFTINRRSLSDASVSGIANKTYTGTAQTQNLEVKVGDRTLVNDTDYTLSYANNTNAGTATVTITGKGNYTGTVSKNFTINAASLASAEVSGIAGRTYNGAAQTQSPTVKVGGRTLTNGTDYTLSYSNNTNAGTATVSITGKSNYTGTVSKAFTISAASLSGAEVSGIAGRTYNGSAQTQNPTVKLGGRTLTNGTDYTLSYANNTNAGTATVTITGKGNYNGSISKTFTINAASLSGAEVSGLAGRTYNGAAQTQSPTVKVGGRTLTNGTDYTLSYANNTNAGTATVTITGKGNYTGTVSKTFTISQAAPKLSFASAKVEKTTLSAPFANTLSKATDGAVGFTSGNTNVAVVDNSGKVTIKGVGTTTITATAAAGKNYKAGSASYTLTVVDGRTDISVCKITLSPASYTYDGAAKKPAVTVKNGTTALTNGTDYTVAYANNTNAGTATVTVTGKGSYAGTLTSTFTINRRSLSDASVSGIANKTYTGTAQTQNLEVKVGDRALVNDTDYTLSYANNTNAGTATVTITGKGNYSGTISKTFTVSQAAPKLSFASAKVEKTTLSAAFTNTLTKTTDGTITFKSGDTKVATVDSNGLVTVKGIGTTTITATAAVGKNYKAGSASYTLIVTDGRMDISGCTISFSPTSYIYDGTAKKPAVTVKNGTTTLTNATDYTAVYKDNTNAGTATVVVTGKGNYTGTASKTFKINRRSIDSATVTGLSAKTYDGSEQIQEPVVKVGDKTLTSGTDYTVSYENNVNAGEATLNVNGKGNYTGNVSAAFTIRKAAPTMKFAKSSLAKVETDAAFTNELTVTTDGTVTYKSSNTDVAAVNNTSGKVTIKGTGTTTITATASEGTNYKAGSVRYTLTVAESGAIKSISLSEESITMVYGNERAVPSVSYNPESATDEKTVEWNSSDAALVTVENGMIKAMDPGKAVITATVPGSKVSASADVRVLFRDVTDDGSWYFDAVYWALDNNVTSGYGKGTFQPMAELTRAQTVMFLYKMAGSPDVSGLAAQEFTDVKNSDWYCNAVKWAAANKITTGYGQGTFRPNATCTRAMIVSFLMRYAKLTGTYITPISSSDFSDVAPSAWYKDAVDWAVENGITKGYGQGTFKPDVTCTRAMMVTFLKRTVELPKVY